LVDAEGQLEMQARVGDADDLAEAFDDRALLGLDGIEQAEVSPSRDQYGRDDADQAKLTRARRARPAAATQAAPVAAAASARALIPVFARSEYVLLEPFFRCAHPQGLLIKSARMNI